jgi:hypothetical protein
MFEMMGKDLQEDRGQKSGDTNIFNCPKKSDS